METLADSWVLWLVLTGVIGGMMIFYRESRRAPGGESSFPSQDEFAVSSILFGVRRGEGDLFLGYLGAMICFSLFLAGFVRWVATFF